MFLKKIFNVVKLLLIFTIAIQILSNCTSLAKKETTLEKKDVITALRKAFSPNNDGVLDKQTFKFNIGSSITNPVVSWTLDIKDLNDMVVYTKQSKSILPKEVIWDGKNNYSYIASDGEYIAYLQVNFKKESSFTGKTESFYLDTIAPNISIQYDKEFFTPDNDGVDDIMYMNFTSVQDLSGIKNWKISIYNPDDNKEFSSIRGEGKPDGVYYWNGKSNDDGQIVVVESATDYPIEIYTEDNAGNNSTTKELIPITIGILVNNIDKGRFNIRISNIKFKSDSSVMTDDNKNIKILNMLAVALNKYPNYKIVIEGYANKWRTGLSEKKGYDLSIERAQLIVNELVKRDVNSDNLLVKGMGFKDPIVPLKIVMTIQEKESMKINRRVEFYKQ